MNEKQCNCCKEMKILLLDDEKLCLECVIVMGMLHEEENPEERFEEISESTGVNRHVYDLIVEYGRN